MLSVVCKKKLEKISRTAYLSNGTVGTHKSFLSGKINRAIKSGLTLQPEMLAQKLPRKWLWGKITFHSLGRTKTLRFKFKLNIQ